MLLNCGVPGGYIPSLWRPDAADEKRYALLPQFAPYLSIFDFRRILDAYGAQAHSAQNGHQGAGQNGKPAGDRPNPHLLLCS